MADTGVAFCVWPGNLFAALEGDDDGCWFGLTELPFVCTNGTEGFFILVGAPADLDATTAAMLVTMTVAGLGPLQIAPRSYAGAAIAQS